jgi:hypothetical protein
MISSLWVGCGLGGEVAGGGGVWREELNCIIRSCQFPRYWFHNIRNVVTFLNVLSPKHDGQEDASTVLVMQSTNNSEVAHDVLTCKAS